MGWPLWRAVPELPHSSLHTCWPIWSGGGPTTILYIPMHRCGWRLCSRENEMANVWCTALGTELPPWQPAEPPDAGRRARCSLTPCHRFPLESQENQVQLRCHVAGRWVKALAEALEWSLRGCAERLPRPCEEMW